MGWPLQARAVQEGRASEAGADIRRLQDHNHRTPHNVAFTYGHTAMLQVLSACIISMPCDDMRFDESRNAGFILSGNACLSM